MTADAVCACCEMAREVELFDRYRILVCDGGWDEMVRTCPLDGCDFYDEKMALEVGADARA